ncbi:MAG: ATP-binding protein, partial [Candidatus Rokubacteria bacterium]|nr:ATP-binding protein [Candidatus Rokubacteria bacterium]
VVLDEVQRAPEVFLPIKAAVDRDRRPGRFLLTGSANPLLLPRIAGTLVGRVEVLTLWPLSQGELAARPEAFVDGVFGEKLPAAGRPLPVRALIDRVVAGGYPEALARGGGPRGDRRRTDWFRNYVRTLAERDVRDIAQVEGLVQFPRLLALLAAWSGRILTLADLARVRAMPETTLKRYTALLRATFVLETLPAWGTDLARRAIKHPKVLLNDTGLIAALQGIEADRFSSSRGPMAPSWVSRSRARRPPGRGTSPASEPCRRSRDGASAAASSCILASTPSPSARVSLPCRSHVSGNGPGRRRPSRAPGAAAPPAGRLRDPGALAICDSALTRPRDRPRAA